MDRKAMQCPNEHGTMKLEKLNRRTEFRGTDIEFQTEHYVCPVCGIEVGDIEQTAAAQKAISDAYRRKTGLLTSHEIRDGRKECGVSQADLARRMGVGIASIKRWEGALIQSKSMDQALRLALQGQTVGDVYTGNRRLSVERINMVLREFEANLGKPLLVKHDRMLYAAKYLWYADMVAYRELGRSMTGATYARLPHGPQLNNYRDLVDEIMGADITRAEPLTIEEKRIVAKISRAFPYKSWVFKAAHNEKVWERRSNGEIIPYSDADALNGI